MNELRNASVLSIRSMTFADPGSNRRMVSAIRQRARTENATSYAFITVADDGEADSLDGYRLTGSLAGVPYACKDVFNTKTLPTTAGSRVLSENHPTTDAAAVQKLHAAGASLVGKANMHEFCYGITGENKVYGTPVNPHDPTCIAGGSSSGSALSTASGTSAFSIGSDTGGSIRVPAALCGLVGMKPTYGLVSTKGMIPFCWTLDHAGLITRSVADAASVLEVLAGWNDKVDQTGATPLEQSLTSQGPSNLKGIKVGIPRRHFFERLDPEVGHAVERVLEMCQKLGAILVEVQSPDMEHIRPASLAIQLAEATSVHAPWMANKSELYGEDVLTGIVQGQFILAEHYVQSLRFVEKIRTDFAALFRQVDVLITPTTPIVAPKIGARSLRVDGQEELVGNALTRNTCVFNMSGNPAITLPCGWHSSGLPIGVQLVGKPHEDGRLLKFANDIEGVI